MRFARSVPLLVLASSLLIFTSLVASPVPARQQRLKPTPPRTAPWQPKLQEEFVPYWTLEPGWDTALQIRNNVIAHEIMVMPVLRVAGGTEFPLKPVTLAPNQSVSIDLRQASEQAGSKVMEQNELYGAVILRYSAMDTWNIWSTTSVFRSASQISFDFDGADIDNNIRAASYEAIWWLPGDASTDYLIVSNASAKALHASLVMSDASGRQAASTLALPARQTVRLDVRTLLGSDGLTGTQGGISIRMTHGGGAVEAAGIVYDVTTGFSAMMKTFVRDPKQDVTNRTMRSPMVSLSSPAPAPRLPTGESASPKAFLYNAATESMVLIGKLLWYGCAVSGSVNLSPITLLAGATQKVDLAQWARGKIPANAGWATIVLSYRGRSGDLVPVSFAQGRSGSYIMQAPFREGGAPLWKGSMWRIDATHDTLLVAGNAGDKPTTTAITLVYNRGKSTYTVEKLLRPDEQMWADVGSIIGNQTPDKDGHRISQTVANGTYEVRDVDNPIRGKVYERELIFDKTYDQAAYGCAVCCGDR